MKKFSKNNETLCISNECLREAKRFYSEGNGFLQECIDASYTNLGINCDPFDNKTKINFLNFCKQMLGLERKLNVAILRAEGEDKSGKWVYSDGLFRSKPVQNWINENDGKYDLLILHACNPNKRKPEIKNSLALVPQANVSFTNGYAGENLITIPNKGAIQFNRIKINENNKDFYKLMTDLQSYNPDN